MNFLALVLWIGTIPYRIVYDCSVFGAVRFFPDDSLQMRQLLVCKTSSDQQRKLDAEHELFHICFHDHEHHFTTKADLLQHLGHLYSEEQAAEFVSPCVARNRRVLYRTFGVNP